MSTLPKSIQNLINEFAKLPGIGPKTASRLAFYLLKTPDLDLQSFAAAVAGLQKNLIYCSVCFNMAESSTCKICADSARNHSIICVVEDPLDVQALDQIADFHGVYHVLGGVISPLDAIGPDNLKIAELLKRLEKLDQPEVILTTNLSMEGEATAMYIARLLKQPQFAHVKITRIARGLPSGADLEYTDEYTLSKALEGRREY